MIVDYYTHIKLEFKKEYPSAEEMEKLIAERLAGDLKKGLRLVRVHGTKVAGISDD